jgi:16S rRNA (cytosine967-C5)-methyltransferase
LAKTGTKNSRKSSVRSVAAEILYRVLNGHSLTRALEQSSARVQEKDRALLSELCYGSCRWYFRLEYLLARLMKKPLRQRDADIHALLIVGLYQLSFMRIKPHAVVQETVNAARHLGKPAFVKLVNGVLRNFQRQSEALVSAGKDGRMAEYAMPLWLLKQLEKDWPEHFSSIAKALLNPPPMTLRVNVRKNSVQDYVKELASEGLTAHPVTGVGSALVLDSAVPVERLPGFFEGKVSVQDAGAQLAAQILKAEGNSDVLDACAAPGGKTGHILEQGDNLRVVAMDIDEGRLVKVGENLQRLGLEAELKVGDAGSSEGDWSTRQYDFILLDVPCSATGVIRRHPDIKLLRREQDIAGLVEQQRRILLNIWPLLKKGGRLLYATCSILSKENENQIEWFLKQHKAIELKPETLVAHVDRKHGIQLLPEESGMDGFYYALLEKGSDEQKD